MNRIVLPCLLVGLFGSVAAQGAVCDIDADGNVDRADMELIFAARNTQASGADDARDADGNGLITVLDGRQCALRCTLPNCALVDANAAPVAVAGADRSVAVGESVQLDGSGSHDADADALTPRWSFTALPQDSQAVLSDPTGLFPTFVTDRPGTYVIQLIVNDGTVDSVPDTVAIRALESLVRVPEVVGLSLAQAEALIAAAGLEVEDLDRRNSDTVPAEHVISQQPAGGALVAPDEAVRLVVSRGPDTTGGLVSAVVGPAGGTVALADGAKVEIPPGALDREVTITIRVIPMPENAILPPTAVLASKIYSFEPDGLGFMTPAEIVIPYDISLLPPGYEEGGISIYRLYPDNKFHMVGSAFNVTIGEDGELEPIHESSGQGLDTENNSVSTGVFGFSAYGALGVRSIDEFVEVLLENEGAAVRVFRPQDGELRTTRPDIHFCQENNISNTTQGNLSTRLERDIQAIVLHSTNNANIDRIFSHELGWAGNDCNKFFAHYYIHRNGGIYQLVADTTIANHTRSNSTTGIGNSNSIGIELFNNVGEPYDGRQIAALVRLLDYLTLEYNIPRPQRNPQTGIVTLDPQVFRT